MNLTASPPAILKFRKNEMTNEGKEETEMTTQVKMNSSAIPHDV